MSIELENVKGIGKKADVLKEAGIDTVEKLSKVKLEELTELKEKLEISKKETKKRSYDLSLPV